MEQGHVILVVEDERPLLEAIKIKLQKEGFTVVTARTGKQALNYLHELDKVDAVWVDHYLLGKEDGLEVVGKIKEEGSVYKKLPVFVVSNTATPEKIKSYLRLGVDKYYVKAEYKLSDIIGDIKETLK